MIPKYFASGSLTFKEPNLASSTFWGKLIKRFAFLRKSELAWTLDVSRTEVFVLKSRNGRPYYVLQDGSKRVGVVFVDVEKPQCSSFIIFSKAAMGLLKKLATSCKAVIQIVDEGVVQLNCDRKLAEMTIAIGEGNVDEVRKLLDTGFDPHCVGEGFSHSAWQSAIEAGAVNICKVLLKNGSKVEPVGYDLPLLHFAARESQVKIVSLLKQHTNVRYHPSAEAILRHSLRSSIHQGLIGTTKWEYCRHVGRGIRRIEELMPELAQIGDLPRVLGELLGPTCGHGNAKLVDWLLAQGANLKEVDEYGRTPLFNAHDVLIAKRLLDSGAEVNAMNMYGCTPLGSVRRPETMQLLLDRGADIGIRDVLGVGLVWHTANSLRTCKFWNAGKFRSAIQSLDSGYLKVLKRLIKQPDPAIGKHPDSEPSAIGILTELKLEKSVRFLSSQTLKST